MKHEIRESIFGGYLWNVQMWIMVSDAESLMGLWQVVINHADDCFDDNNIVDGGKKQLQKK